jgi:isochorismate hydrolase
MSDPETRPPRSNQLLSKTASRLVVVDVQQKLLEHIPVAGSLVENCRRLVRGAQVLDVPVAATEQYPAGLGPTTQVLSELLDEIPEKLRFSCAECLDWVPEGEGQEQRDQVVVCGIEAHVCVLQTSLDLAAQGFRVFVVADAVASRHKLDWKIALGRLADSGVVVLTTESVLFEWCEVAGTDEFRQISRLVTGKDKA